MSTNGSDQTTSVHDLPLVRRLALDDITVDECVQARAKMVVGVVTEAYAEAMRQGDAFPPIDVFQDDETYILADGFTRHAAAKRAGLTEIACRVHAGALRDAKLFAVGANATHGHPRSAEDKRCAVLKLLNDDEWFTWSDHEIGRHCHVSHQLVGKLRPLTGRATSERRQFRSKHGTVGKMKTERIGKTHKSRKAGELGDQPGSLSPSVNKNETEITLHTAPSVENAPAAVSLIDRSAADDEIQVYAEQHVDPAKALAILAEFLKFVLARIGRQDRNFVVTIVEQDAAEFRCLCHRAESAGRAESDSLGNDGVVHDESDDQADGLKLTRGGDRMTNNPLGERVNPCEYDGLGRKISWRHLVAASSLKEVSHYLGSFDSYARTKAMTYLMMASSPRRVLEIFLSWNDACDAPWPYRWYLADKLRDAIIKVPLIDLLEPPERDFYSALPRLVPVWRGCERGRVRGLSWTTDRMVAEGFALGRRCRNEHPTLIRAEIPKQHIFGVFLGRKESELALDPRRLRKLSQEPFTAGDS